MMKKTKLVSTIPLEFNAGWATFLFILKKNLKDDDGAKCYGITDFNKFTITLEEGMSEKEAHHTIIHECSHVLMETLGLGGPDEGQPDVVGTTNESLTEATCRAFLMFRNLNPILWHLLFEAHYE